MSGSSGCKSLMCVGSSRCNQDLISFKKLRHPFMAHQKKIPEAHIIDAFADRDFREHTCELVRNAKGGQLSMVSKHGRPLFVAMPYKDARLVAGVSVSLAGQLVQSGKLSASPGAKLFVMPQGRYLQHLSATGYSLLDDIASLADELALLAKF